MKKEEKEKLEKFLSSIECDKVLWKYDIKTNIVWVEMLKNKGIIDKSKAKKVISVLKRLEKKFDKEQVKGEDIHFVIEGLLEKELGKDKELAGIIRTGRSRNDLVVNDERLYLKDEIKEIINLLYHVIANMVDIAEKNLDVIMCGETHLQPAQPVLFSHYILSFCWMLVRDIERLKDCYKRVDVSVLGSAAFSGTSFDVDIDWVARKLGFSKVIENSVDGVSDRDYLIEFIFCCLCIMLHLSRLAEQFILWLHPNFGYIKISEEVTSGSSIMPQKQNPDYLELVRAKCGKVLGDLVGIVTVMKGLPLSYNRDMQDDKIYLNSTINNVKDSLTVVSLVLKNVEVVKENIKKTLEYDFIYATEIANYLVDKFDFEFKKAHRTVNEIVEYCRHKNKKIKELSFEEIKSFVPRLSNEQYQEILSISSEKIVYKIKSSCGSSVVSVEGQIKKLKKLLNSVWK